MAKTYEHEIRIETGTRLATIRECLWEMNDDPPSANDIWRQERISVYYEHIYELFQRVDYEFEQVLESTNRKIDPSIAWYLNGERINPVDLEQDYYDSMDED